MEDQVPAKATGPGDQSDSIVVSFGAQWHTPLLARKFKVVIRKRVPRASSFTWLYFHVNSPISAICARAKIIKVFDASLEQATVMSQDIGLSPAEIVTYIGGDSSIGCYQLGKFEFGSRPLPMNEITRRLIYHAPQSFVILSKPAKAIIDSLGGYLNPTGRKSSAA